MTSETDNGVTTTYSYDATGQLLEADSTSYSYDANGNSTVSGNVIGTDNELQSTSTATLSYDAEGNLIGMTSAADGSSWTYSYNNANQMTSAVQKSVTETVLQTVSYTYDAIGESIERDSTSGSTTTVEKFSYDADGTLYAVLNSCDVVQTRYYPVWVVRRIGWRR